jgi:hypothetical protein
VKSIVPVTSNPDTLVVTDVEVVENVEVDEEVEATSVVRYGPVIQMRHAPPLAVL